MICVDASLAAKLLFREERASSETLTLITAEFAAGEPVIAPQFLPIEVTNIIRQRQRRHGVSLARATELLREFLALPFALMMPDGLHEEALQLADTYALPATYDAYYIALAQREACDLWTADQRLVRHLGGRLAWVRLIDDRIEGNAGP